MPRLRAPEWLTHPCAPPGTRVATERTVVSVQSALVETTPELRPVLDIAGPPRCGEYAERRRPDEGALLEHVADDLASLIAQGCPPGGLKVLGLDGSPGATVDLLVEAIRRRGPSARVTHVPGDHGEDLPRSALLDGGPRGRVVALFLGQGLRTRAPVELRRTMRAVRRSMLRGDLVVVAGAAPQNRALASPRILDLDQMVSMSAAAGFQVLGQWWAETEGGAALALLAAD